MKCPRDLRLASRIGLLTAHGISSRDDALDDMLDTFYNSWRSSIRRLEVEPGLGDEALDEEGAILHPFEPGLLQ